MADVSVQTRESPPLTTHSIGPVAGPSKRIATVGLVLVVLVGAVALGLRISGASSSSGPSMLRGALVSMFRNQTASVAISETIDIEGQVGTARGIGKCNLQHDACSSTLVYYGALAQLGTESMVYSNRKMYLKLAGTVGASFPTPWISLALKASNRPSALGSTGSPLAGLALLTRDGSILKDEGTNYVDGVAMHQYGVTAGNSESNGVVSRRTIGLPMWLANPATLGPLGARSMTIDVNAAGNIGRMEFTTSAVQDGTYAIVHATETVRQYGTPVTIVVPPKEQQTFVNALAGTLTRYCAPAPGLRLGPSSKPIVTRH